MYICICCEFVSSEPCTRTEGEGVVGELDSPTTLSPSVRARGSLQTNSAPLVKQSEIQQQVQSLGWQGLLQLEHVL